MDVRLKTTPFDFDGKTFHLCCNMNVLAEVQEAYNGNLLAALKNPGSLKSSMIFLAAMMNDYAEDQGWPERYSAKQIGRKLSGNSTNVKVLTTQIGMLVRSSLTEKPDGGSETSKN